MIHEYIIKVDDEKKDFMGGMPLIDKPQELVRCEECVFHDAGENEVDAWDRCKLHCINTEPDNYCSWAVKKNG